MSGAEERSLLERWRVHNDRAALGGLVRGYIERVERIADAFARFELAREDLVQEGLVGLLTAIERFDVARGIRLADYARSWVRMRMVRFVLSSLTPFRVAEHRVAVAESIAGACSSIDDRRSQRSLGPLADPGPSAEQWIAAVEEESERERSLQARLARLTADERAVIGALHFGEPASSAPLADAADVEWNALSKLLVEPGEETGGVHVLVRGRRRRLVQGRLGCVF